MASSALEADKQAQPTVGKIIDTRLRADLLIVDEIGFVPLDDTGTLLLFR